MPHSYLLSMILISTWTITLITIAENWSACCGHRPYTVLL